MKTDEFWAGEFGDAYIGRNVVPYESRVPFWQSAIDHCKPEKVLEVGCNVGHNLLAIQSIDHDIDTFGLDVNRSAVSKAREQGVNAEEGQAKYLRNHFQAGSMDLVFTAGVLIHVAPDDLFEVMRQIVDTSKQYVLAIEYEAEQEEAVEYRGHEGKLWRRPFGKLYEEFGLRTVAFGDAEGFERCTYWLMEKVATA